MGWLGQGPAPAGDNADGHGTFPLAPGATTVELRALVDRSSVEFFVAGGRAALTVRSYPAAGATGAYIAASADAVAASVLAHEMGCGWS